MRSIAEIRDRLLEDVRLTIGRPLMGGGSADGAETLLLHLLKTLCFIDEREEEWAVVTSIFVQGCRGVQGDFEFQHRPFPDSYVNEIASVYAEVAFSLGYFRPARMLAEAEMSRLAMEVRGAEFRGRDWTQAELHARFGPPSHEVVGGYTTVACYGCESPSVRWVFFDLSRRLPWVEDWLPVPLLRDFRNGHHNRMHLLPVGKRWVGGKSAPKFTRQSNQELPQTPPPDLFSSVSVPRRGC